MSKQSKPIRRQCQSRDQCERTAKIGVYVWAQGASDVNLDKPFRVYCGVHKPRMRYGYLARNVKLRVA